jgi:hypothetical protein
VVIINIYIYIYIYVCRYYKNLMDFITCRRFKIMNLVLCSSELMKQDHGQTNGEIRITSCRVYVKMLIKGTLTQFVERYLLHNLSRRHIYTLAKFSRNIIA